jgi:hypothetical protein
MDESTTPDLANLAAQRQAVRDRIASDAAVPTLPVGDWVRLQHDEIALSKQIFLLGGQ